MAKQQTQDLDKKIDTALGEEKSTQTTSAPVSTPPPSQAVTSPEPVGPKMIQVTEADWEKVQEQLKMLYEVADKSRVFSYEAQKAGQKKPLRVKLSLYRESVIVGWRTVKDESVFHPTTGKQIGEVQQYEVLLRNNQGQITKALIDGYKGFSDARYTERVECEVVSKKEDWEGKMEFNVRLPNNDIIPVDSRFVN